MKPLTESSAARKIKALKPGATFDVKTSTERVIVNRVARTLRACGAIHFQVITKKMDGVGYRVVCVAD